MRFPLRTVVIAVAAVLFPTISLASLDLSIGYLSFDNPIPGAPGSPGVNAFTVGNLTGDPLSGGFALPPTFPVLTNLTFKNSSLELFSGGLLTQTLNLGDIGPGFFSPNDLQFPDTQNFSSALFMATLDFTSLQLDGGGSLTASSDQISALLLPSIGNTLTAGTDFTLIEVAAVPEPDSLFLLGCVVAILSVVKRRHCL
jgi:hypothetical protein